MYSFLPDPLVQEVTNQGKTHGLRIPINEHFRVQFNFVWKWWACSQQAYLYVALFAFNACFHLCI